MDENFYDKYIRHNLENYKIKGYDLKDYSIDYIYNDFQKSLEEKIQTEIEKERTRYRNMAKSSQGMIIQQTDEEKLDSIELSVIERYLRKRN